MKIILILESIDDCGCDNEQQVNCGATILYTYVWNDKVVSDPTTAKLSLATVQEIILLSTF